MRSLCLDRIFIRYRKGFHHLGAAIVAGATLFVSLDVAAESEWMEDLG